MSEVSDEIASEPTWLPDGRSLGEADVMGIPIHLRLTAPDGRSARGACDFGLGQWWTGAPAEVTCRHCLEVVHA